MRLTTHTQEWVLYNINLIFLQKILITDLDYSTARVSNTVLYNHMSQVNYGNLNQMFSQNLFFVYAYRVFRLLYLMTPQIAEIAIEILSATVNRTRTHYSAENGRKCHLRTALHTKPSQCSVIIPRRPYVYCILDFRAHGREGRAKTDTTLIARP